ncbi:MAG: phosphoribosylamine--glycine ligase [Gammaproteobacteria bacterium]|nr:phosphoribosylamine--glycine ligase [Gammaproteobacteria bacterium]
MKVLVIGNGGREHALAWKLSQSPEVHIVYVAPGNAGTATARKAANVAIAADNIDALLEFAQQNKVELTVVGPEVPLVAGIVDRFDAAGLRCFGPAQAAAQLEGSKAFAKAFLDRHAIPTAAYREFTELAAAVAYIETQSVPLVIKADGLAAGKGVVIAMSTAEALNAAARMLSGDAFGQAGRRIIVEEFLEGEEASFIAIVDGEHVLPLASSQDHKARDEGGTGPNTGGMGAYSPAPAVDADTHARIMRDVIKPAVAGLVSDGIYYRGFLYAGLMLGTDGRPRVLEFNCRCGDPETQPIMMRMRSDLVKLIQAALDGKLHDEELEWDKRAALGVVLTAGGYPGDYATGELIEGLGAEQPEVVVFHAGTAITPAGIKTDGGRVLCVCALGDSVSEAQARAYARIDSLNWPQMYYRRDIGHRAVARETL